MFCLPIVPLLLVIPPHFVIYERGVFERLDCDSQPALGADSGTMSCIVLASMGRTVVVVFFTHFSYFSAWILVSTEIYTV